MAEFENIMPLKSAAILFGRIAVEPTVKLHMLDQAPVPFAFIAFTFQ